MKTFKLIILLMALIGIVLAYQVSAQQENAPAYGSMTGDVEKGKALFNDKNFGHGKAGLSCNSCHPKGGGVEASGEKKKFNIMGEKQSSLEEAVNFCIVKALKGTAIDSNSKDMKDIVSYIRSLKK